MSLRTLFVSAFCAASVLTLASCGGEDNAPAAAADSHHLKVGVCPGPYGAMLQQVIAPILEADGYTVEVVEFTDYVQPDLALESGDIDANLMQHQAYLEEIVRNQGLKIESVTSVPTLGMGLFSDKVSDLSAIPEGASAAIPNDAVNLARTLRFCRDLGLISLKEDKDDQKASLSDIESNPYNLNFTAMEAAQIPRTLDSVDLAFVPGNYAYAAKLDYVKALAIEEVAEPIKNVIAVRQGDKRLHDLFFKTVRSAKFKTAIELSEDFSRFPRPQWWQEVK